MKIGIKKGLYLQTLYPFFDDLIFLKINLERNEGIENE